MYPLTVKLTEDELGSLTDIWTDRQQFLEPSEVFNFATIAVDVPEPVEDLDPGHRVFVTIEILGAATNVSLQDDDDHVVD